MNLARTLSRATTAALSVLVLGLALEGCNHKSGRSVPNGTAGADLIVVNQSSRTLEVYVDRVRIGSIPAWQTGSYEITRGIRTVHLRESGDAWLHYYGEFNFDDVNQIQITYDGVRNLVVQNDSTRTLHVFIDGSEIGDITPGDKRDYWVPPGSHDVHVRERGDTFLTYVGTFSFSSTKDNEVFLIYKP